MKKVLFGNDMDRMPDWAFRTMAFMFDVTDFFKSSEKKLDQFGIRKGQKVIDYGSGTGRYLKKASELVGEKGLVFAIDIHELAIKSAFSVIEKYNLKNVKPIYSNGKTVDIPPLTADIIYALDMFHMVKDTNGFLIELNRMMKAGGTLFLEDGHQPRASTRNKILDSGCWDIIAENKKFLTCSPKAI